MQERIARSIVDKLRVRASPTTARRSCIGAAPCRGAGPRASRPLCRAAENREGLLAAVALLARAEVLDSAYAEVATTEAIVYQSLALFADQSRVPGQSGLTAGQMLRQARDAAARAVRLDSTSASAHTALGVLVSVTIGTGRSPSASCGVVSR